FVMYSNGRSPFKREPELADMQIREELGAVVYVSQQDPNILGFKGPRKMTVLLLGMTRNGERPEFRPTTVSICTFFRWLSMRQKNFITNHIRY
ncbi:4869_t:CDS:2, partial [Cetraspora pellucida]